jgi:hypothetical protein
MKWILYTWQRREKRVQVAKENVSLALHGWHAVSFPQEHVAPRPRVGGGEI